MSLRRGAFDLASAFAGGGGAYADAKAAAEKQSMLMAGLHADTDRKVDQAIMEQQQRLALQAIDADPSIPRPVKNMVLGKVAGEFANAALAEQRQQETGFRSSAVSAALAGDWNAGNANMLGVANGPVALTDVDGGLIVRNKFRDDARVETNAVGASQVAENFAQADAAAARAAGTRARTADPQRFLKPSAGGKGGKPKDFSAPAQHELVAYFGNPDAQFRQQDGTVRPWTPEEREQRRKYVNAFEAWRAANPDYRDGSEALAAYKQSLRSRGVSKVSVNPAPTPTAAVVTGPSGAVVPARPAAAPPVPGARMAPDGKWYIPDPNRRGKYLEVL